MSKNTEKILFVILAGLAFGTSVVMARFALKEISPYPLVVFRFGIASVAYVMTLLLLKKKIPWNRNKLRDIAIVGLTNTGLPLLLFLIALTYLSSGVFTVLFSTVPIFTAIGAHLFLKDEKLSRKLLFGLVLGFGGIALLLYTKTNGLMGESFHIIGPLVVLLGACIMAGGAVYARKKLLKEDVWVVSGLQTIAGFFVVSLIVFGLGKFSLGHISPLGWFSIFYNAIIGSYVAFLLVFLLVKRHGATASSLPGYVMPIASTIMGALLLGELITMPLVIGCLIIFIGIFFAAK